MNRKKFDSLILKSIQSERRLHLKSTTQDMFQVSSLLYGGISGAALFVLLFPTWPELNQLGIFICAIFGLMISAFFYLYRASAPLWLVALHIPFGLVLASIGIYFGQSDQSLGFSVMYVLSSAYLFHFHTKTVAIITLVIAMIAFIIALDLINIKVWPSTIIFIFSTCFLMGLVVWQITHRMHQLNIKDSLTGLFNRQTINALTQNLLEKYAEHATKFEFIMIDLNQFKMVNDTYGHIQGDQVLIQFSRILKQCTDKNDYVARWGGDEFIVIITTGNNKRQFEAILREKTKHIIGFELGCSQPQENDSLDSLTHRADKNMYINKHRRRATDDKSIIDK